MSHPGIPFRQGGEEVKLVAPASGDLITLNSETADLGRYLLEVSEQEAILRDCKRAVSQEILRRLDANAKWTTTVPGGLKISGDSPAPTESWDGAELFAALNDLVEQGVISIDAVNSAVEVVITYKAKKTGINSLRKLGGRVAQVVNDLARIEEKDRRVRVSRL